MEFVWQILDARGPDNQRVKSDKASSSHPCFLDIRPLKRTDVKDAGEVDKQMKESVCIYSSGLGQAFPPPSPSFVRIE